MRNAMDAQEVAVGWWPGDARYGKAAFYAYAHPAPDGFAEATLIARRARWECELGEYVLDWDDVVASADPHALGARVRPLGVPPRLRDVSMGPGARRQRGGNAAPGGVSRSRVGVATAPRERSAMSTVETVKGKVEASELGTTLIHEHVRFRDEAVAENWPGRYDDQAELDAALAAVECGQGARRPDDRRPDRDVRRPRRAVHEPRRRADRGQHRLRAPVSTAMTTCPTTSRTATWT